MRKIKFGYFLPFVQPEEVIRQGVLAETCGFDTIWFPDHLCTVNPTTVCPDVWSILAALGFKTKRSMLVSGVTDPLRRHPATTAQTVATLDRLLGGRIMLGIGAGEDMNLVPYGIDHPRVDRLKEAVECIKLLWAATYEKRANYHGVYYQLDHACLTIKPRQRPHPPIYIGALGPRTRELVGEVADGWLPWLTYPAAFKEDLKDIERGTTRAGRNLQDIDPVASVYVAISDRRNEAKKAIEQECKEALVLEGRILTRLGYDTKLPDDVLIQRFISSKEATEAVTQAAKAVPMDAVDAISVYGSADECIGRIEEFLKVGARHIIVSNLGPNVDKSLKTFGEVIIPHFKARAH